MKWRLTQQAFENLTIDRYFTRAQVERIVVELDRLAAERNPRQPLSVNVCALRDMPGQYRLRIQTDELKARMLFEIWDAQGIIVVWACLPRTDNCYRIAGILLESGKAGV